jgi:hypothetical protein
MRTNAHLAIRHDAWRFMPPGSPRYVGKDVVNYFWPEQKSDAHSAQAEDIDQRRDLAAELTALLRLRSELAAIKFGLKLRRLLYAGKYSPNQPRDEIGRWTDNGSGLGGDNGVRPTRLADAASLINPGVVSDASPIGTNPGGAYAQNDRSTGYPVDLMEERQLGGHAIERHVGRSPASLLNDVRREQLEAEKAGFAEGLRVGSFPSLEAANKLVNATLARNQDQVNFVASGISPRQQLNARFDSVIGYEAYAANERSQPYIQDTNGVRVVIVRDRLSTKGFRVDTAFPIDLDR